MRAKALEFHVQGILYLVLCTTFQESAPDGGHNIWWDLRSDDGTGRALCF